MQGLRGGQISSGRARVPSIVKLLFCYTGWSGNTLCMVLVYGGVMGYWEFEIVASSCVSDVIEYINY